MQTTSLLKCVICDIFSFWFQQASNPPSNAAPSWKQKQQQTSAVNGGSSAPPKPAKPPHTSAPSFASGGGGTARFVPPSDGPANIAMAMEATAEIQGMIDLEMRESSKSREDQQALHKKVVTNYIIG